MEKKHIWLRHAGNGRYRTWCSRSAEETSDVPTVHSEPERSDCLRCVEALRDRDMHKATQASRNVQALTVRLESLRRARSRAKNQKGSK